MKLTRATLPYLLSAALGLPLASPAAEDETAKEEAEVSFEDIFKKAPPPPEHLNGFGSGEPLARQDRPTRGVLTVFGDQMPAQDMAHWKQHDHAQLDFPRWGRYEVELTYRMQRAGLPVQFRIGDQRLKASIKGGGAAKTVSLGSVYVEKPGVQPFSLYFPTEGDSAELVLESLSFVPTAEGEEGPEVGENGSLTFHARNATTWSDTMRYEPKAEKNCLGFWKEAEDFAEWEFEVDKPGRYQVIVTQGCGEGQGGSKVAVRAGSSEVVFEVRDTGGFQSWEDVEAGVIELREAGTHYLVVDPQEVVDKAALDVQKVVLKPAA